MVKTPLNIIDQIRQAARDSGISQNGLARATGMNPAAVNRFINGERGLSMEGLAALASVLRLRVVVDDDTAGGKSK